jgi:FkbM family methyltransferase
MAKLPDHPLWLVWHPHQKLWNWRLVHGLGRLPLGSVLVGLVVWLDSVLLGLRVWSRRLRLLGLGAFRSRPLGRLTVLYVDCGVHRRGQELRFVSEQLGDTYDLRLIAFEASPRNFADALQNLADVPGVDLRGCALVGPDYEGQTVRLFRTKDKFGRGDSLFAERGDRDYDEVPAVRLSAALTDSGLAPSCMITILRMNIEGAEHFVIEDLVESGQAGDIDGYHGMWDDLSKIDPEQDRSFRRLLRDNHIHPITFNARDLQHRMRRRSIVRDLDTTIRFGAARKPAG